MATINKYVNGCKLDNSDSCPDYLTLLDERCPEAKIREESERFCNNQHPGYTIENVMCKARKAFDLGMKCRDQHDQQVRDIITQCRTPSISPIEQGVTYVPELPTTPINSSRPQEICYAAINSLGAEATQNLTDGEPPFGLIPSENVCPSTSSYLTAGTALATGALPSPNNDFQIMNASTCPTELSPYQMPSISPIEQGVTYVPKLPTTPINSSRLQEICYAAITSLGAEATQNLTDGEPPVSLIPSENVCPSTSSYLTVGTALATVAASALLGYALYKLGRKIFLSTPKKEIPGGKAPTPSRPIAQKEPAAIKAMPKVDGQENADRVQTQTASGTVPPEETEDVQAPCTHERHCNIIPSYSKESVNATRKEDPVSLHRQASARDVFGKVDGREIAKAMNIAPGITGYIKATYQFGKAFVYCTARAVAYLFKAILTLPFTFLSRGRNVFTDSAKMVGRNTLHMGASLVGILQPHAGRAVAFRELEYLTGYDRGFLETLV